MVRFVQSRIFTLRHAVIARRMLWAFCLHCGHAKRLDPRSLAYEFGDMEFVEMEHKLRCERCGQRGRARVVPHDQEWPGRD